MGDTDDAIRELEKQLGHLTPAGLHAVNTILRERREAWALVEWLGNQQTPRSVEDSVRGWVGARVRANELLGR